MAESSIAGIAGNPADLTDRQLDDAITTLAARSRPEVINYRKEKLHRAYFVALNNRINADPNLANTTTVSVT